MKTYSTRDVADMFSKQSDWWLKQGVRDGKYPHLRIGRVVRFTDAHVEEIAALLEVRSSEPKPVDPATDVAVFGATKRSQSRHRTRKTA